MPIVRPDFGTRKEYAPTVWVPGRMVVKVSEIKESQRTDNAGHNALIFKFEVTKAPDTALHGKTISRWFPLGGPGVKVLWRCLKTLNPSYNGMQFDTSDYIGKFMEVDVELAPDKEGKVWPKISKMFPYFQPNEVAVNLKGNIMDVVGLVDDFDV